MSDAEEYTEEESILEEEIRVEEEYSAFQWAHRPLVKRTTVWHDNAHHTYEPGDVPPPAHALLMTNPKLWEDVKSEARVPQHDEQELAFEVEKPKKMATDASSESVQVFQNDDGTPDYDALKVPQIIKLATERGVDLGTATRKAQYIEKLRAADAESQVSDDE